VNIERLVKKFRVATDGKAKDRILSDALDVLAEIRCTQEIPAMVTNGGMMQSQGFLPGMDPVRLMKLVALGVLIALGYVGTQYIAYIFYLQIAFR
jgi:hypothetical protein